MQTMQSVPFPFNSIFNFPSVPNQSMAKSVFSETAISTEIECFVHKSSSSDLCIDQNGIDEDDSFSSASLSSPQPLSPKHIKSNSNHSNTKLIDIELPVTDQNNKKNIEVIELIDSPSHHNQHDHHTHRHHHHHKDHKDHHHRRHKTSPFNKYCISQTPEWILYLNNLDRLFSFKIHQLSMGAIDYLFVFGAFVFGSKFMPITILISIFIVEISGFLFLLISCFITVCATQFGKKWFSRHRPDPNTFGTKILDFRTRLTNYSFPSGDTAQSAAYATSLYLLTNNIWLLLLIPNCAWSRIYFGCHYIGDCIFGACIGFIIPYCIYYITSSSSSSSDIFINTQHRIEYYWMH